MAKPAYLVVFITTSSYEEARKIADALVDSEESGMCKYSAQGELAVQVEGQNRGS